MAAWEFPLDELRAARVYSVRLIESFSNDDWFRMPANATTHLAWQVGHLAMAEFRLALVRIRGARPSDEAILPASFVQLFGKGSMPLVDESAYPRPRELRATLDAVHEAVLREIPTIADHEFFAPSPPPHPEFTTKIGALAWCGRHEMLHAGQIGLLRRLLGHEPIW